MSVRSVKSDNDATYHRLAKGAQPVFVVVALGAWSRSELPEFVEVCHKVGEADTRSEGGLRSGGGSRNGGLRHGYEWDDAQE